MVLAKDVQCLIFVLLNERMWFRQRDLKTQAVAPIYLYSNPSDSTVAIYTISLVRHLFCKGHWCLFLQLHSLTQLVVSVILLFWVVVVTPLKSNSANLVIS